MRETITNSRNTSFNTISLKVDQVDMYDENIIANKFNQNFKTRDTIGLNFIDNQQHPLNALSYFKPTYTDEVKYINQMVILCAKEWDDIPVVILQKII